MNRTSLQIVLAGAWILTIAAAFVAGRKTTPETTNSKKTGLAAIQPGKSGRAGHAAGLPGAPNRPDHKSSRLSGSMSEQDLIEHLNQLLVEPDCNTRISRFLDYVARLSNDDFSLVAAELANGPFNDMRRSEYAMLISEWTARDPYAAADYFKDNANNDWEREAVLSEWAARDPQGAFDWAASTPDSGKVNNWISGAMKGIAATDPDLAARLLDSMEPSPTRDHSMRSAALSIAALGPERASQWLSSLSDPKLRQSAAWMIADPLARSNPATAGNWVATIPDADARNAATKVVAQRWARTDVQAARTWMEALPPESQPRAAEGIASEFARSDPQAAADWLTSLGPSPDFDPARRRFLDTAYKRAPESAANVASSITNPKLRNQYLYRIIPRWASQNLAAAQAWVSANPSIVPDPIQKRLFHR